MSLLSDGRCNALSAGAEARPLRPAHLLEHLEAHILAGELVLLVLAVVPGGSALHRLYNSEHVNKYVGKNKPVHWKNVGIE